MSLIKATPAQYLGQVFATNEAEAIKEAAKDWNWSTSYGLIGGQDDPYRLEPVVDHDTGYHPTISRRSLVRHRFGAEVALAQAIDQKRGQARQRLAAAS
jgi:hypothetical protein